MQTKLAAQKDWWWIADQGLVNSKTLTPLSVAKSNRVLVRNKNLEIHWTDYTFVGNNRIDQPHKMLIRKNSQGNVSLQMLSDKLHTIISRDREEGLEPLRNYTEQATKVVVYLGFDH
jgi:hypothetical protein